MKTFKLLLILFLFISITGFNVANAFMFWNQACSFNGTAASFIAAPNSATLNLTGNFTLEAWLNPVNSVSPPLQMIMDKRNGVNPSGYTLYLSNGKVAIATNSSMRLIGSNVLPNNIWTHVSVAFNSSTDLFSIYLNGQLDASGSSINSEPISNTDSLKIGKGSGSINSFAGIMDEVRIWERTLSSTEVSKFRRTTLGSSTGAYTSLILSYTFQDNESSGTDFSLLDWSNNNNNGINKGVTAFDLSNRPSVTITPNDCIDLNGTNDYLTGNDNTDVSPVAAITMEAWIYPRTLTGNKILIHKGTTAATGINYSLRLNGNFLMAIINGNGSFNSSSGIISNQWTHVAFTYEGISGKYVFFINGRKAGEGLNSQGNIVNGTEELFIGGNGTSGNFFNGFIDEIRISNYVKNNSDITRFLYRSIDQANEPNSGFVNVVYNLDGYAADNADNGPLLNFISGAAFAHSGAVDNQPVSPINRADDLNFSNSYHLKTSNKRIPETGIFGVVIDTLEINFDTLINDVNVFVALNHSSEEEMDIYLIGPGGENVLLYANQSLVQNSDNVITVFNDQSDSSVINNFRYVSYSPSIKPRNSLNSVFAGKHTPGKWKLLINDETGSGIGKLCAWGVQFNTMSAVIPGLSLRVFMEGFYREIDSCVTDTIKVHLKSSASPYPDVGIKYETPDNLFVGNYNFPAAVLGINYYLQVQHRNSIEIWSAHPVAFDLLSGGLSYDFTVSKDSAYGSNQIQVEDVPLRFAMYSGDVNQDGSVDLTDLGAVDNDAAIFAAGYLSTDVNGDNGVDISDMTITDNNAYNFISKIVPP